MENKQKLALQLVDLNRGLDLLLHSLTKTMSSMGIDINKMLDMAKLREGLRTEAAGVYAEEYTEDELRAAVDYAQSPCGESLLNKYKIIANRMEEVSERVMRSAMH